MLHTHYEHMQVQFQSTSHTMKKCCLHDRSSPEVKHRLICLQEAQELYNCLLDKFPCFEWIETTTEKGFFPDLAYGTVSELPGQMEARINETLAQRP